MQNLKLNKNNRIHDIISFVKIISLFYCAIAFLGPISLFNVTLISNGLNGMFTFIIFACSIIIIYQTYRLSIDKNVKNTRTGIIIEIIMFMLIFFIVNYTMGKSATQYNFLYLFIIINTTIQYGIRYGMPVAVVSSVLVLGTDILRYPGKSVNMHFQNDLILVGVFMLTAWLLGYYVKVEREYSDHMYNLANIDELTDVYNHRYFHEELNNQLEIARKNNTCLSVLFLDIDSFKDYNDLFGHMTGDKILREVGSIINSMIKPPGVVARYGGEEFAVILPNTSEDKAFLVSEKIRKRIEENVFDAENNSENNHLTISIGISSYPEKALNKKDLITNSDEALYRAKFLGKNRVERHISILEEIKNEIEDKHLDIISSIKTFINLINLRDRYTYGHTERVVMFCELLASELNLNSEDRKTLKFGAYLHDIGKVEIDKELLNKKLPLTNEEWEILKLHPENAAKIIKPVESLNKVIPLILHHHEKYDGTGYPYGLKGKEIPYLVRIVTVADSVDAMTSNRPYKPGKTFDEAIEELKYYSGTQFDPEIANAMIKVLKEKIQEDKKVALNSA